MSSDGSAATHERVAVGIALGRLQPLHTMHLQYLLAAAEQCEHLVVGITNPIRHNVFESVSDPPRSLPESNPFSYFERYLMVRDSLEEAGLARTAFDIVPAPLGSSDLLECLPSPKVATVFVTVYDAWGAERIELLTRLGYRVEVLWNRPASEKGITGTEVRRAMRGADDWRSSVPAAVARLIDGFDAGVAGLVERTHAAEADGDKHHRDD